jgi:AcrR family transcriptional regulator
MRMTTRLSADERRDTIVAAASIEFAAAGYAGTSTDAIARRAGVSQPYVFQLFGTKKDLFLAAVKDCFERTGQTFVQSGTRARAAAPDPRSILEEMGHAYVRLLLANPTLLRLQLQAYAACEDDEIRAMVRDNYKLLWQTVTDISGADAKSVQTWFAQGMLINVAASIGEGSSFEGFLGSFLGGAVENC